MLWHLRSLDPDGFDAVLAASRDDTLGYDGVGCSLEPSAPSGLTRHAWSCDLGGPTSFDRVAAALGTWDVHRRAGIAVAADGPLAVGTNVVLDAPLPVGFVVATCRVVRVVDDDERFGFAYGALHRHPERGEESFVVRRAADGRSRFDLVAWSAPAHPLARLAPPVATRLQRSASRRYLRAAIEIARTA